MKILVRNLSRSTTEQQIERLFSAHGTVSQSTLVMDPVSGGSKGFGFVEMEDEQQAMAAISALNQADIDGVKIRVKPAED